MASFIYSSEPYTGGAIKIDRMNGTQAYLRHYANLLYLKFIANSGDRQEKVQAASEILICERKLKFWQNHPNYDDREALLGVEKLKKDWRSPAAPI